MDMNTWSRWRRSTVTFTPYQAMTRQIAAPAIEVNILTMASFFEFNRLTSKSITTCPSLLSTQVAARNVSHRRQYSVTSITHSIGLWKKYLKTTSAVTDSMIKAMSMAAKKAKMSIPRSNMVQAFLSNFIAYHMQDTSVLSSVVPML